MINPENENQELPSIPPAIWGLGIAVFFVNLSSVMIRSLVPVYMKSVLGVATSWIGILEGIVEGLSFLTKLLSGVYSDYLRRRKFIIVLGYTLCLLSRPLMAIFSTFHAVVAAKILDRLGNGIQASPRDALVGDLSPQPIRGACYGLRISLGTAGSFFGALFGLMLMYWNDDDYQKVFWLASIPAMISVLIMTFMIREPEQNMHPKDKQLRKPIHLSDIPRLGRDYWLLMVVVCIFLIAQLGEAIMVLHAHQNFGLLGKNTPLILLIYNSTYSLFSYPAGRLSDQFGRYNVLAVGFVCLIVGDLLLAYATNVETVLIGVAFCGIQMAVTQSLFMSLVADSVPEDLRGTGFGMFYLICACSVLISNSAAGLIADYYGESMSFICSMFIAIFALLLLLIISPRKKQQLETVA